MKPDFVVIGAEKSGTTSLYYYLREHPGIFVPPVKELNHLIHHPAMRSVFQGPDVTYKRACRSRIEYLQVFEDAPRGSVIGEITHIYLYAPESPGMIHEVLGGPKIIAVIRNPMDRAYSQFTFHKKFGLDPLPTFEEALDDEQARITAGWDPVFHYTERGFYGRQLHRYYRLFPESSIRIYKFEDFFRNPVASMADLYGFVGTDPTYVPDVTRKFMPGGDPRAPEFIASPNKGVPLAKPIAPETHHRLREIYMEDIHETERLTGLDLSDWLGERADNVS
jgi:hypothetical protein